MQPVQTEFRLDRLQKGLLVTCGGGAAFFFERLGGVADGVTVDVGGGVASFFIFWIGVGTIRLDRAFFAVVTGRFIDQTGCRFGYSAQGWSFVFDHVGHVV